MPDPDDTIDPAPHWNANADQWAEDVRAGHDYYRDLFTWPAFEAFLGPVAGLKVVDFGCGEGTNTRRLAQRGAMMTGIDISEGMLAHARHAESEDPLGIAYQTGSFSEDTGLEAASFDLVISTLALMDGPDLPGAMDEAFRLLRPGGMLVFSVTHPCFITRGIRWETATNGRRTGLVAEGYFDATPFNDEWYFSMRPGGRPARLFSVPRFPRTLSDYVSAALGAGFEIIGMEEPVPSEAAISEKPTLARWRDLAAFLLLVRARRSGNFADQTQAGR